MVSHSSRRAEAALCALGVAHSGARVLLAGLGRVEEYAAYEAAQKAKHEARVERERVAADAEAAAKEAAREKLRAERAAWLCEHVPELVERFEAGFSAESEIRGAIATQILGWNFPRYARKRGPDVKHHANCDYSESEGSYGVNRWSTDVVESVPLTAEQFATLKAIRAQAATLEGATVEIREHTAILSCDCPNPTWLGVLVSVSRLGYELSREFAL